MLLVVAPVSNIMASLARAPSLVIFDCDGVLVDSEPLAIRVLIATMRDLGVVLSQAECYEYFLGRGLSSLKATLKDKFGKVLTDAQLNDMRLRLHGLYRRELLPIEGIAATLEGLRLPFCVASSSQPERIRLSLEVTGLSGFFGDRVFSASMVAEGKPAPDLFLHAAEHMGHAPKDCVVVEDSPAGIEAAGRAGMRAMAFIGGSHAVAAGLRETVAAKWPCCIFERMDQLPSLLENLATG